MNVSSLLWRCALLLLLPAIAFAGEAGQVAGRVLDAEGKPLSGTEVVLEIGKAHYDLTPEFNRWYAIRTERAKTDADGRFSFTGIPEGASGTVSVKTPDAFASALGTDETELKLEPLGSIVGKVFGKKSHLRGLRVYVRGGAGFGGEEGIVNEDTGLYEVESIVPGKARVSILRNNFYVARFDADVKAGKKCGAKPARVMDGFLPSTDPVVDVIKVRLVDRKTRPVAGVQLIWSSQWMDGGMNSDEEGIVPLAGGAVAIGGPPYLLRLRSLKSDTEFFHGVFRRVLKGVAVVELKPLQEVMGVVKRGDASVKNYRLFVVGPGKNPHVYGARVGDGRYSVRIPEGKCRFVVGTEGGKLHEHDLKVSLSDDPTTHKIELK